MQLELHNDYKIKSIKVQNIKVPFNGKTGFVVTKKDGLKFDVFLHKTGNEYVGLFEGIKFTLKYIQCDDILKIKTTIENTTNNDYDYRISFVTGIDSYMEKYPQWHETFFPTLLRCEKTHMWGYYLNTSKNALVISTSVGINSYDILYNRLESGSFGHRILGTELIFFMDESMPERHPDNLRVLNAKTSYENTISLAVVDDTSKIYEKLKEMDIPVIYADKYTLEKGEKLNFNVLANKKYKSVIEKPSGQIFTNENCILDEYGVYTLTVTDENQKIAQAKFYCRKDWEFYLKEAAKEAIAKPQKASTHVESFYGLFSCFLSEKHFHDENLIKQAYECFEEIMPYMFDFDEAKPIISPNRIQNIALFISLLVDMYEVDPLKNVKFLELASKFADVLLERQDKNGVYRCGRVHYTCVIYIAKALLELWEAEKNSEINEFDKKAKLHFDSVKRAVDELVLNLDNIDTEGELTLEDGMISCSALQIAAFAMNLPENERKKYIDASEYMMKIHSCLEQQLIPDCRMNGASLRYWESQYDVMIYANMLNSPHGWTAWTAYAYYYLYMLTGKEKYLISLMNIMGTCVQLMSLDGKLRWGFCAQPYVKAKTLVPDFTKEVEDGYDFVDLKNKAYRGRLEEHTFGEEYIDMISGWYRCGNQKVTGGYQKCPLIYSEGYIFVDNQGGCCDNDVHEIFKCLEETVLGRAFILERSDGTFLCYSCNVKKVNDSLEIITDDNICVVSYNLQKEYKINNDKKIFGFGLLSLSDKKRRNVNK